jgi:uncharacterized surface protein with fasciclin (FAS1) repeats
MRQDPRRFIAATLLTGLALLAAAALIEPARAHDGAHPIDCYAPADLKTAAMRTGLLTRMAEITRLAGLDGASAGAGRSITIFAPSDAAFEALPEHFKTAILKPENKALLADLLLHHVVLGSYPAHRMVYARAPRVAIEAVDGGQIIFNVRQGVAIDDIDGAKLVRTDIRATNGVLHVIDKVLVPPAIMAAIESQAQKTAEVGEPDVPDAVIPAE